MVQLCGRVMTSLDAVVAATEYQPSPPISRYGRLAGRLVVAFAVALTATAALTWWMSAIEVSTWWLVVAIGVPAGLAAAWCASGLGRRVLFGVGVTLAVACALVAWRIWVPVPAAFVTLRANVGPATATARHVIATTQPHTCLAPTPGDLGPLASQGPWAQVCVGGIPAEGWGIYELLRPPGSTQPSLSYDSRGLHSGGGGACWRHVVGRWYAHLQGGTGGPTGASCPYGYTFDGGG